MLDDFFKKWMIFLSTLLSRIGKKSLHNKEISLIYPLYIYISTNYKNSANQTVLPNKLESFIPIESRFWQKSTIINRYYSCSYYVFNPMTTSFEE